MDFIQNEISEEILSRQNYDVLMNLCPISVAFYDKHQNIFDCNEKAAEMIGLDSKQDYIRLSYDLMPPFQPEGKASAKLFKGLIRKALKQGSVKDTFYFQNISGKLVLVEIMMKRLNDIVVVYANDLTAILTSLERERDALEETKTTLNNMPLGVATWDDQGNLIHCNNTMLELFGYPNIDRFRDRVKEGLFRNPLDSDNYDIALKEGRTEYEQTYILDSGEKMPAEVIMTRIAKKNDTRVIVYVHDLRSLRAEMAKRDKADERAALILNNSPISCFIIKKVFDSDGNVEFEAIDFNDAAIKLFEFDSREEAAELFYQIFPTEPNERVADIIAQRTEKAYREGSDHFRFEHESIGGKYISCDITLVKIDDEEDILACFQNDRTEIANDLQAMEEKRNIAERFLNAAPVFIEMWNKDFELIDCNQTAVEIFGFSSKEEYIRGVMKLAPEYQPDGTLTREKSFDLLTDCFANGSVRSEWMHSTRDGQPFPMETTYVRLDRGDGELIAVGYIQDLRATVEEAKKRQAAEEENKAKTQFLARMSHEIRTPMNSIMGIAEIELQKNIHTAEAEDAFERIFESSRFLLGVINDILDLAKVEAGKMELSPRPYQMASLIADTLQLNNIYITKKEQVEFVLDINENLPMSLLGDELRIKQIISNLLSNAFKYTNEGKVTLKLDIQEKTNGELELILVVADTGLGMTPEQVAKLMGREEYTRFTSNHDRNIEGTGIGLTIMHKLIDLMGGNIQIYSEVKKGSTITVSLPQKPLDEHRQTIGAELKQSLEESKDAKSLRKATFIQTYEPMPYGRVLVVDDVESNIYVVKGHLKPYRISVDAVESGAEAIEKIENGAIYDIIFMDHMMPYMDGIEATKILRSMGYLEPIVALTANAVVGASQLFMDNGFSGFISKPIDPKKLNAHLMEFVHKKQRLEVIEAARAQYAKVPEPETSGISDRLKQSFLKDANNIVNVLESLIKIGTLDSGAYRLYTIQTHAAKSALANIEKLELSKTAGILEEAGRNQDAEIIKKETPQFLEGLKEIINSLSNKTKEDKEIKNTNVQTKDYSSISKMFMDISEACSSYDILSSQKLLNELKTQNLDDLSAALDDIEDYILSGDYEEAGELSKKVADGIMLQKGLKYE